MIWLFLCIIAGLMGWLVLLICDTVLQYQSRNHQFQERLKEIEHDALSSKFDSQELNEIYKKLDELELYKKRVDTLTVKAGFKL